MTILLLIKKQDKSISLIELLEDLRDNSTFLSSISLPDEELPIRDRAARYDLTYRTIKNGEVGAQDG